MSDLLRTTIVVDTRGGPVAAPCAIDGCSYSKVEADLGDARARIAALETEVEHWHAHYDAALANWQTCLDTLAAIRALRDQWRVEQKTLEELAAGRPEGSRSHEAYARGAFDYGVCADQLDALLQGIPPAQTP